MMSNQEIPTTNASINNTFGKASQVVQSVRNELKKAIILEHYDAMLKFHGEYGAIMFRKLLHSYSKGYTGATEFREIINRVSDVNIMRDMCESFF